jgi:hypothetical protein
MIGRKLEPGFDDLFRRVRMQSEAELSADVLHYLVLG